MILIPLFRILAIHLYHLSMKLPGPKITIPIIILWCFITRLPQLCSPNLLLDGDECVVGIMAKHIFEAKELPLFYWGQQYGFTLIECLYILPFYLLLGINALAVKLAMLSLWTTGVMFLYKMLRQLHTGSDWIPFLLVLVFIVHPAWAVWSMKARGGYLSAFTLSNVVLYICFHPYHRKKGVTYVLAGIILAFIYVSQPFWLVGVVPLMLYAAFNSGKRLHLVLIISGFIPLFLLFRWYTANLFSYYAPSAYIPEDFSRLQQQIVRIPVFLYHSLHGNYFFDMIQKPNLFCAIQSVAFEVLVFLAVIAGLYYFIFKRKGNGLFISSVVFIPACLLLTIFFGSMQARYLLPVSGFLLITLQLYLNPIQTLKPFYISSIAFILAGTVSLITFWNFRFMNNEMIFDMVRYFRKNNIRYVYSIDWSVPWQVTFYSNETIIIRMPMWQGRYEAYTRMADAAVNRGETVGFIGYMGDLPGHKLREVIKCDHMIYGIGPSKEELFGNHFVPE